MDSAGDLMNQDETCVFPEPPQRTSTITRHPTESSCSVEECLPVLETGRQDSVLEIGQWRQGDRAVSWRQGSGDRETGQYLGDRAVETGRQGSILETGQWRQGDRAVSWRQGSGDRETGQYLGDRAVETGQCFGDRAVETGQCFGDRTVETGSLSSL
ncbi:hypothetical protein NHX12_013314 [Muraenolepis orangiensis]|uniref:Uncharacterized protein n=1 Tax=Muraenolepis orangiensis TaxID=630683 RepID=A0A9Q0DHX3_9TELE|nr:hypothetical protein NHX12_013314 [Muraenolepis orangiensis]